MFKKKIKNYQVNYIDKIKRWNEILSIYSHNSRCYEEILQNLQNYYKKLVAFEDVKRSKFLTFKENIKGYGKKELALKKKLEANSIKKSEKEILIEEKIKKIKNSIEINERNIRKIKNNIQSIKDKYPVNTSNCVAYKFGSDIDGNLTFELLKNNIRNPMLNNVVLFCGDEPQVISCAKTKISLNFLVDICNNLFNAYNGLEYKKILEFKKLKIQLYTNQVRISLKKFRINLRIEHFFLEMHKLFENLKTYIQ